MDGDTLHGARHAHEPRRVRDHGAGCECLALAAAVGIDPRNLRYEFCLRVLQRHWWLACQHGAPGPCPASPMMRVAWREIGALDGVKALLVREA